MKIINAIADQAVSQLSHGDWFVHTIFEHTLNLTDRTHLPLILLAGVQDKQLPGGVYLPETDFKRLQSQLADIENITLHDDALDITTTQEFWHIIFHERYQLELGPIAFDDDRLNRFYQATHKLDKRTGFDQPFTSFLTEATSPFKDQINGLMDDLMVKKSIDFFIGRGRGLTPSGDDFILGWSLIDRTDGQCQVLNQAVAQKIESPNFTTDISRSYLSWAMQGHYSSALLKIIAYLNGAGDPDSIDHLLQIAIDYGNTSGIDTLSGLVSAIVFKGLV